MQKGAVVSTNVMAEIARVPNEGGGDGGREDRDFHIEGEAFVTMVTSDDFVIGAETMLHSLRDHCTKNKNKTRQRALVVMVTPGVSGLRKQALSAAADHVIEVSNCKNPRSRDCQHSAFWIASTRPKSETAKPLQTRLRFRTKKQNTEFILK